MFASMYALTCTISEPYQEGILHARYGHTPMETHSGDHTVIDHISNDRRRPAATSGSGCISLTQYKLLLQ